MNKIILADSQAIFRAGTAKVLAMDEDVRIIAQCTDLDRMYHAITTFPSSIVLFAASLHPELIRLRALLESVGSRGIVIAENNEAAGTYIQQGFRGVVFRCVTGPALVECVRAVANGDTWLPPQQMVPDSPEEDMVGPQHGPHNQQHRLEIHGEKFQETLPNPVRLDLVGHEALEDESEEPSHTQSQNGECHASPKVQNPGPPCLDGQSFDGKASRQAQDEQPLQGPYGVLE